MSSTLDFNYHMICWWLPPLYLQHTPFSKLNNISNCILYICIFQVQYVKNWSFFFSLKAAHLLGSPNSKMVMVLWVHLVASDSCSSMNCSPPGFSVHKIFQAKKLDWVAISSSRGIFQTQGWNLHLSAFPALQADSFPSKPSGKLHKW